MNKWVIIIDADRSKKDQQSKGKRICGGMEKGRTDRENKFAKFVGNQL